MDVKWIFNKIVNIITQPDKEWQRIRDDKKSFNFHIKNFALPLIIALSLAKFINMAVFHQGYLFADSFLFTIITFASSYVGMYLASIIISYLANSFSSVHNKDLCFKMIIYSSTPIYLASMVTNLFPSLDFLNIFFLYSIYLLWLGLDVLFKTPEKNKIGFMIIIVLILFGSVGAIYNVLNAILPVSNIIVA